MGISINSHGKKVDKETQSPLLKIFKDIMTREKDDPEKRNLLMEHKEDSKKRRHYSGSRSKTEHRSRESSISEQRKRNSPYKTSSTEQRAEYKQGRTQSHSMPFQSEKKDSWWFWQKDQKKQTEDTCSCVSCALKKLVNSEYACIACLLLVFTISIVVAFLVVFKSVPSISAEDDGTKKMLPGPRLMDSERLKRKIEMLNENQMRNDLAGLDEYRGNDKKGYDDALSGHIRVPGVAGIDFGPSFRELSSVEESDTKLSGNVDWNSVLDTDRTSDMQSSEKLREFYRKLVQTDAKIRNLKKFNREAYLENENFILKSPERSKRSLKIYSYPKRYHVIRQRRSALNKNHILDESSFKRKGNKTRLKRFIGFEEPTGFVIEKKKLIVQYKPSGIKKKIPVKKCSHAPKDSHTHENQLKHPFYQNTQRLDELLDRFLNKNLPEIMVDPFGIDMLFKHEKTNKCKHPNPNKNVDIMIDQEQLIDQIPKPKSKMKKVKDEKKIEAHTSIDILKMLRPESTTQYEKEFYHHEAKMIGDEKKKIVTASPNDFEVLLSVSTIMNPDIKKTAKIPVASILEKVPNLRRLMQLDNEDDDTIGYEDFKEVLTDDMENHDEMDKGNDRKKRKDEQPPLPVEKIPKYNPPGVHNPNWKGPMPLYPDELNSMIKHAATNANKVEIPTKTIYHQSKFLGRKGRDVSDVEYVEDYLRNKYDKLVEMAQAYSDYGVLDGKKESRNEKNTGSDITAKDHKIKLEDANDKIFKAGLLERVKKDRPTSVVTATTTKTRRQRDVLSSNIEDTTEQTVGFSNTFFFTQPRKSEGIRIEIVPTTKSRDDDMEVLKILQNHIKIEPTVEMLHPTNLLKTSDIHATLLSSYPDMELVYSANTEKSKVSNIEPNKKIFKSDDIESDNGLIFALSKGKRNLLSTDFKSTDDFHFNKDTTGDWGGYLNPDLNRTAIDKFVAKLNIKSSNSKEKALIRYIERAKAKNIIIYSTVQPDISNLTYTTKRFDENQSTFKLNKILSNDRPKSFLHDTIVTINKSEIRLDDYTGNNFLGKICLTVENPDIGVERIDLKFDVPLRINFNDELMLMNDNVNFPNVNNQFEVVTEPPVEQSTDIDILEIDFGGIPDESYENKTFGKRHKRDITLIEYKKPEILTTDPFFITTDSTSDTNITTNLTSNTNNTTNLNSNTNITTNLTSNNSINFNASMNNRTMNKTDSEMSLSDFFMMVSEWFKALEGLKVEKSKNRTASDLIETLLKINSSKKSRSTTDTAYLIYDSDMIENIGHRSRVLLSIENLANTTDEKKKAGDTNVTRGRADASGGNVSNITNSSTPVTVLTPDITTPKKDTDTETNVPEKDSKTKVKLVFKRNADDSNLIFWNDIYDDEYGIQIDKLDNSVRDKHSVKENDFIMRSGRWVHDKIKQFAENLKLNPRQEDMAIKERLPRSVRNPRLSAYPRYVHDRITDRIGKREPEDREEEEYDTEQKSIFTALSANMKDVCRKAARAVHLTTEVREDSKQGSIAATLMQQLVRLLTDLVDYQVQQKTCTKLPPELQSFLEWLTYPREDTQEAQSEALTFKTPFQDQEDLIEELEMQNEDKTTERNEYTNQSSNEKHGPLDVRAHYLECLHSVEELLRQFEDMTDDEKSKMTGVKNYLENQMRYINKQLSGYDLFTLFEKHHNMRYKRDLQGKKHYQIKRRHRRKLNKFMKNFGKKHTRTTASFYDAVLVTDMKRKTVRNEDRLEAKIIPNLDDKVSNDVKRNLKDVYYKAIAEAKKYATVKSIHKKDEITRFESSTNKIHQ